MPKNAKTSKKNPSFYCKFCDFKCSKLSNYNIHLKTKKHAANALQMKNAQETVETDGNNDFYDVNDLNEVDYIEETMPELHLCQCGKNYTTKSGLWKHKKSCELKKPNYPYETMDQLPKDFKITTEMFYELLKQHNELQKSIVELLKEKGPMNISNCGNNNKTFNLNMYLNETCKNALNISDFVNQIQLTIADLEETGRLGYAEGISKVFIKNLNEMEINERPIHCSDSKRETLYIKDDNVWHKEDINKNILTKAIKQLANKNIKQITEWQKLYPNYNDPSSKQSDKYMKIVLNSMSGSTKEESDKNYEKIIKNIIKETVIDKSNYQI